MIARGLVWLGVPTDRYQETVDFFRDVLGCTMEFEEHATTELSFADGDRVQVFGPGHRYHDFYRELTNGVVLLIEVDDVDTAREEIVRAGVEIVGGTEQDAGWRWIHVRAPDGHLYELASRR